MVRDGHITKLEKCTTDHFINPIVITAMKDGSIKPAMDAKPRNAQIWKSKYQMPNIQKLIDWAAQIVTSDVPGLVWFTSLDVKYAFSQLKFSKLTSSHCNFNIICGESTGTYRFNTGFFGLTDMPSEFQKAMDCTFQGIPGTICYLDDILGVSKGTLSQHTEIVHNVFSRLDEEVLALKLSKCKFAVDKLDWLGFEIHSSTYAPKFSKIEAVRSVKAPRTLKQLRSFMGTLNHLQKFMPGLHNLTCEFRDSLKLCNKRKFFWNEPQEAAFQKILDLVAEVTDLFHYDPAKRTRVKCDASHFGLGACLEQETEEDLWVPITFASRFLNSAKYSTNQLELLAVVWASEHFLTYLLGNKFEINTDHKAIFSALKEHS